MRIVAVEDDPPAGRSSAHNLRDGRIGLELVDVLGENVDEWYDILDERVTAGRNLIGAKRKGWA